MSRSIFGWDYPPGCSGTPWDEPDPPCDVCGKLEDNCLCPECPECGAFGDPHCYDNHGLVRTPEQIASKTEMDRLIEEENNRINASYDDYINEGGFIEYEARKESKNE